MTLRDHRLGGEFVGKEVVREAVEKRGGTVGNVAPVVECGISFEHRDQLVICFSLVDESEATDWTSAHEDVSMMHHSLGEDADIDRVSITDDLVLNTTIGTGARERIHAQLRDLITT